MAGGWSARLGALIVFRAWYCSGVAHGWILTELIIELVYAPRQYWTGIAMGLQLAGAVGSDDDHGDAAYAEEGAQSQAPVYGFDSLEEHVGEDQNNEGRC